MGPLAMKVAPQKNSKCKVLPRASTVTELWQHGVETLDEFEAALLKKVDQLEGGRSRIICTLNRGLTEVESYPGYLWDRVGKSECNPWRFEKNARFTSVVM